MYNVKDLEAVKKNWRSFWNHEFIGRPYVLVTAPKDGTAVEKKDETYVKKLKDARRGDFASAVRDFEEIAKATMHYGESLPHYKADLCPDQYAAFYGAEVEARDGEYTTWIKEPVAEELCDLDLTFHRDNEFFQMVEKSVRTAAEIANGNFIVHVPDYHSNLDALSALLSPQNLCYELMDNPELLEEKLAQINGDFGKIYDIFYEAGNMKETGTLSWLNAYCEDRMTVIQCDFSCMMSPAQARQFVIPSIEKELESVDRAIYHYDGKMALGHFDDVMAVKRLDCIQWTPGAGQKRTIYWMDLLKKVQAGGKSVWLRDWTAEEILADTELDPALTAFTLNLKSEREAEEFMEKLEKKYR
ncbi:MAG: hypothetical protein E7620_07545 [Ruminococcaceae bacterium]|nr:hypothetical protein [Oscillospiraceae bacterium]